MEYELVAVYWLDSVTACETPWNDISETLEWGRQDPEECITCGILLDDKPGHMTIALSVDGKHCGPHTMIPRAIIQRVEKLGVTSPHGKSNEGKKEKVQHEAW